MHTCVFCQQECQPAPTERGWTHISPPNGGPGKGLHFDCAMKVVLNGLNIYRNESEKKISNTIMDILKEKVLFSTQTGAFIIHDAVDILANLIHINAIVFGTWYSGMEQKKVVNGYKRFYEEERNGQGVQVVDQANLSESPFKNFAPPNPSTNFFEKNTGIGQGENTGAGAQVIAPIFSELQIETNNIPKTPEQIYNTWYAVGTRFTGLTGTAQFKTEIEKIMTEYHPPQPK